MWLLHSMLGSHMIHKTSIYRQESQVLILCCLIYFFWLSKCWELLICILWITKAQGPQLELQIFLCSTKEKVTYLLDRARVSKLTAKINLWVNYPFKSTFDQLNFFFFRTLYLQGFMSICKKITWDISKHNSKEWRARNSIWKIA